MIFKTPLLMPSHTKKLPALTMEKVKLEIKCGPAMINLGLSSPRPRLVVVMTKSEARSSAKFLLSYFSLPACFRERSQKFSKIRSNRTCKSCSNSKTEAIGAATQLPSRIFPRKSERSRDLIAITATKRLFG